MKKQPTEAKGYAPDQYIASGKKTIQTELEAVEKLLGRMGSDFSAACELLVHCEGRIVVTGMGKSGHIANKIAATFASTGSPAFFVHPGEASHGDLGMITREDVVIGISNSGNTGELLTIVPLIKRMGAKLIAMTGGTDSSLAKAADVCLDVSVPKEACPLGLAPTSSTTATLVMGDALAIALLEARGFSEEDFAFSHPGGSLGKRLLLKVEDVMHSGLEIPRVPAQSSTLDALLEMSEKGLGMTAIVDANDKLLGLFTDGDLRRAIDRGIDIRNTKIDDIMVANCVTIKSGCLAAEAVNVMETRKINGLLVVDADNRLIGALNMHDLLRAGVM